MLKLLTYWVELEIVLLGQRGAYQAKPGQQTLPEESSTLAKIPQGAQGVEWNQLDLKKLDDWDASVTRAVSPDSR